MRPVVVVSPKLPNRSELVTVVPVSTRAPHRDVPYVYRLSRNYAPWGDADLPVWAKCDMVMSVGLHRLSAFRVDRRKFFTPQVSPEDLKGIRDAVLAGLGFPPH